MSGLTEYQDSCTCLAIGIMSGTPTILWGGPGEGKSKTIQSVAEHNRLYLETVLASIRDPSDFAGLPVVNAEDGSVNLAPPGWAKRASTYENSLIFYDEISTAMPATQAALLLPVLENRVGDLQLPDGARTVAAANPTDVAAGGWELTPPLANRFFHMNWELPVDVIVEGFTIGWPTINLPTPNPDDVTRCITEAKALVAFFLRRRPELARKVPTSVDEAGWAFPTPRSWERVATLYGFATACNANSNVIQTLVAGSVGIAAAGEFITYVDNLDLPDPESLLADPESLVVPSDRGDKVFAIASMVFISMSESPTAERWSNAGRILAAIADANFGDVAVVFGKRWIGLRPDGATMHPSIVTSLLPMLQELGRIN
jgi:hypothetical protein